MYIFSQMLIFYDLKLFARCSRPPAGLISPVGCGRGTPPPARQQQLGICLGGYTTPAAAAGVRVNARCILLEH